VSRASECTLKKEGNDVKEQRGKKRRTPPSLYFSVSVAYKGLSQTISLSESTLTNHLVSVDSKEVAG
jgi:hypothetical protein